MSKIFDAMKKAEQEKKAARKPASPVAPPGFGLPQARMLEGIGTELSALRNAVEIALPNRSSRVLLITSALAGEGSTTVTRDFCTLLALDPALKVLAVDGNFSRGSLSGKFNLEPGPGLTEVLRGEVPFEQAIRNTSVANLDFLGGGLGLSGVSQLLSSTQMKTILKNLSTLYHYIVIDSASILSSPESIVLGSHVDGVLLVIRASKTKREIAQKAVTILSQSQANVIGVVFNRRRFAIPQFIYKRL